MPARFPALAAAVAVALAGAAVPHATARAQSLKDAMFGRPSADGRKPQYPPVGRYVAAQGEAFTLDRSNGHPLLKFDDGAEVLALKPEPGARGDIIYKNDVGEPVLRSTRLGGLTLFTETRPTGTPAAFSTPAQPLKARPMSASALLQRLAQASARASRAVGALVTFEAPDVSPGAEPVFADAAALAAEGVVRTAGQRRGRFALSRLRRVRLVQGAAPTVAFARDTLQVTVAPSQGLAGRPSSSRTEQLLSVVR